MTTVLPHPPSLDAIAMRCTTSSSQSSPQEYFAFARIKDDVCLVQGMLFGVMQYPTAKQVLTVIFVYSVASSATPASALTTVDVKIFKHEFISIFRFSEYRTFHPSDICILEAIDAQRTRYEADKEMVFLARDAMERLSKLSRPRVHTFRMDGVQGCGRRTTLVRQRQRQR